MSPSPVPAKPPKTITQVASAGVRSHEMLQLPNLGNFGFDSPTAIFCQTLRWKSGGICGSTFHSANFSLSSSSPILSVKHRVQRKPSSFFARDGDAAESLSVAGIRRLPMRVNLRRRGEWGGAAKGRVDEEICRRDPPITVGRKPRRFWSVRPLVTLPHAPGLSHSLPADNYCIGVRLDWPIHKHGYWRPTLGWRGAQNVASLL